MCACNFGYRYEPDVTYEYGNNTPGEQALNQVGRIKSQTDATGSQVFYYNPLGALISNTRFINVNDCSPISVRTDWTYDTWNRIQTMSYYGNAGDAMPDETIYYHYNFGGLLDGMNGILGNNDEYYYISEMRYDVYEQRTLCVYGNGTKTRYTYEDDCRRLEKLEALRPDGLHYVNKNYKYDFSNNITEVNETANLFQTDLKFRYFYDDLHRLTRAENHMNEDFYIDGNPHHYELNMTYNEAGGITNKEQIHTVNGSPNSATNYHF